MKVKEHIYANQFVPLWEDVTLKEKFEREGNLASRLTGGGIIHFSLGEKITPKQALNIIKDATANGCDYFALNANYAVCPHDHYTFGKHEFCPKCMSETGKKVPIEKNLTRVVGFYTYTDAWSQEKREYDYDRRYFKAANEF